MCSLLREHLKAETTFQVLNRNQHKSSAHMWIMAAELDRADPYKCTHSSQSSTNIKEVYQIPAASGPAKNTSYSPAPRHLGAAPWTGRGPGGMDANLNSCTQSADKWEEVSHSCRGRGHLACCPLKFSSPSHIKSSRPRKNTGGLKATEARGQGSLVNSLGNEFHMRFGRRGEIAENFWS